MKSFKSIRLSVIFSSMFMVTVLITPRLVRAAIWQATVGAQSKDLARQVWRFCLMSFGFKSATVSHGHSPPTKFIR